MITDIPPTEAPSESGCMTRGHGKRLSIDFLARPAVINSSDSRGLKITHQLKS